MPESEVEMKPPDGGYGWFIVVGAFLVFSFVGGTFMSFGVLFVALLDAFGSSKASTALVGSVFAGIGIIANPISLALCNRFGHRKMVMAGGVSAGISILLSSFTTSMTQMIITYGCMASLSMWMVIFPTVSVIAKYFKRRLPVAMGIAMAGSNFGQMVLSVVIQALLDRYGWRGTMVVLAGLNFNICVAGALFWPLNKKSKSTPEETTSENVSMVMSCRSKGGEYRSRHGMGIGTENEELSEKSSDVMARNLSPDIENCDAERKTIIPSNGIMLCCLQTRQKTRNILSTMLDVSLFRNITFILILFTAFCHAAADSSILTHVVRRARDFGIPTFGSTSIVAISGLTQLLSRISWGIVGTWIKKFKRYLLYGFSQALCAVVSVISIYTKSYPGQVVYMVMFGAGMACYITMAPVLVHYFLGPRQFDSGMSMLLQFQSLGALIAPPFVGWLRDTQSDYVIGFYVIAALYIASTVATFILPAVNKSTTRKDQAGDVISREDSAANQ
ncbi:monocarboxylate transporter 12-like [Ptychodera flava]|uniref:monocarboxylate transporter 12-like n=1 Tax=Ptychodera flava TaxID=63121 RepID=UPI00396A41B0